MSYSASSVGYSDSQEPATTPSATTGSGNGCCFKASAELKLYQAFIFSIPVFFTFILLFLFYLFYLRRRRVDWSSLRMRTTHPSFHSESDDSSRAELGIKREVREMLPIIVFKESFSVKDTHCSVCLGDYQAEEKLQQIPACGHTFHMDCIDNWLATHATCPLCRQTILVATKAPCEAPDVQSENDDRSSNSQNGEETSPENGWEHCEDNHQHDGEMCPEDCNPQNGEETSPENGSEHCEDNHQHDGEMSPENLDGRIPMIREEGQTDLQTVRND